LRPFWDLHRHRLAPVVAERLEVLAASGPLVRPVGRIRDSGEGVEVAIRQRASEAVATVRVDAVANGSGSESNYRRLESALVI
jgi:uncharacterized NAD(P)/FAD-binding protein YdhS